MFLPDQGLPRTTPHHLQRLDIEAVQAPTSVFPQRMIQRSFSSRENAVK
jgi:hypothetical protein